MSRIMLAFFCGEKTPPPFYESFITELNKLGHTLLVYQHRFFGLEEWEQIPDDISEKITKFSPELCIFFNNSFYDVTHIVDCPILIYESDSIIYYSNMSTVYSNKDRYYFCCCNDSKEILINKGISLDRIRKTIPFTSIKKEDKNIENNIVFIGSKFTSSSSNGINAFLLQNPSKKERIEYSDAIKILRDNPFLSLNDMIESGILISDKVISNFNIPSLIMELSDENRINVLSSVADLGLELYGTENWSKDYFYHADLTLSYCNKKVMSLKENQDVYNSAKIGISVGHLQAKSGFPWRVLDIMASNACLVSDYHQDFDILFPTGLFPVYHTQYEAREICKALLNNESLRNEIVLGCQEYVLNNFSFNNVRENINALLNRNLI